MKMKKKARSGNFIFSQGNLEKDEKSHGKVEEFSKKKVAS